ncbi:MAG: hypothetical protein K2K65_00040, partial [Duncaniella sp.]|nr:hypothetical protein [Duncaniella sp.]
PLPSSQHLSASSSIPRDFGDNFNFGYLCLTFIEEIFKDMSQIISLHGELKTSEDIEDINEQKRF